MDSSPEAISAYLRNNPHAQLRMGRKLRRTLYLHVPTDDWDSDLCVGIVDSEELALAIVTNWNMHHGRDG